MWPITSTDDLAGAVKSFMIDYLDMDPFQVEDLSYVVTRHRGRPRGNAKDVVSVIFETVAERDDVKYHARNLTSPETGLRPVIVDHLRAAERTLNTMAFLLRTKHPKMKWNIKYADDEMNLKLDFCTGGKTWKTVLPDQAKKIVDQRKGSDKRTPNTVSVKDLDDLLESDDNDAQDEQEPTKNDVAGAAPGSKKKRKKTSFVCLSDTDSGSASDASCETVKNA